MNMQAIQMFHKTRLGYLVFGLAELGLAYVFASFAFNSGNLWQWVVTVIFLFGFLQNFGRMVGFKK